MLHATEPHQAPQPQTWPGPLPRCLTVLTASEQKILERDWVQGTNLNGLPTVRGVVDAVIRKTLELDEPCPDSSTRTLFSDHWRYYRGTEELVLGPAFPAHAVISVNGVAMAREVAEYMNKLFASARHRFPQKLGWTAVDAHHDSAVKLNSDHPFFRYRNTGKMDEKCCRFLIVDEMAIEGMNNKYLLIWGVAESCGSERRAVQRAGRLVRSAAIRRDGKLILPPVSHDQIYIITHEGFDLNSTTSGVAISTVQTIANSIRFLTDMLAATSGIISLDEYAVTEACDSESDVSSAMQLSRWVKLQIMREIGEALNKGERHQVDRIVKRFGGQSHIKKSFVRAYAESALNATPSMCEAVLHGKTVFKLVDAIEDINHNLLRTQPPDPTQVLEAEHMSIKKLEFDEAMEWVDKFNFRSKLLGYVGSTDAEQKTWLDLVNDMYASWEGQFDDHEFDTLETPADRLHSLARDISMHLNVETHYDRVHELVCDGAAAYLDLTRQPLLDDYTEGGRLCKPVITYAFRVENFVSQLQSWVCFMLLKEGLLTDLMVVLGDNQFWEDGAHNV